MELEGKHTANALHLHLSADTNGIRTFFLALRASKTKEESVIRFHTNPTQSKSLLARTWPDQLWWDTENKRTAASAPKLLKRANDFYTSRKRNERDARQCRA